MGDEFEIKDLENLKYFLGIEVARSKVSPCFRENTLLICKSRQVCWDVVLLIGISVSQRKYPPNEFNGKLGNSDDQVSVDKEQYQRPVGKLIYLFHTRPDISFAVSVVNQFMQAPYEKHMEVVNRILRYLKNTPSKG
ncbi:hypothetical protein IC582_004601 [Cucumis melo]